jgi:hypothetical protein
MNSSSENLRTKNIRIVNTACGNENVATPGINGEFSASLSDSFPRKKRIRRGYWLGQWATVGLNSVAKR